MTLEYNPEVIEEYAADLYKQAESLVKMTAIRWGILVGLVGGVGGYIAMNEHSTGVMLGFAVSSGLGAYVGTVIGRSKGFQLKLQAQLALCQARIEENTRHAAKGKLGRAA